MLSQSLNKLILREARALDYGMQGHAFNDESGYAFLVRTRATVIWPGASERTIYGAPEVNWAFRAWHDSVHLARECDFSRAGETTRK